MTRRRTSVIGAQRAARAHTAVGTAPAAGEAVDLPKLGNWAQLAVRELVLSEAGDMQQESLRLAETRRCWAIANGQIAAPGDSGNPAGSKGRSDVRRLKPDRDGQLLWRKRFDLDQTVWQSNETSVLKYLGEVDPHSVEGLRKHVAWLGNLGRRDKGSRLSEVLTLDAGPNLDMWQDFAPCTQVGVAGLPLPLFVQPTFLAALSRQALIALEVVARHGVVHNDLKSGNLCLALPLDWKADRPMVHCTWDLRNLPLRLIDFEVAFAPPQKRLAHAGDNDNVSPYVRACHRAAIGMSDDLDVARQLGGIDWGADLWSIGYMLLGHCAQAKVFIKAYLAAFADTWGTGSRSHRIADEVVSPLLADLGWLSRWATELQTHEHDAANASLGRQATRTEHPHRQLWGELEARFTRLGPGGPASQCRFSLINPNAPLAEEVGASAWARAYDISRDALVSAMAATGEGIRTTSATARRHAAPLATAVSITAVSTIAFISRAELHSSVLALASHLATRQLNAYRSDGAAYERLLSQAWLAVADGLQKNQATTLTLNSLTELPVFDKSATTDPVALAAARSLYLRGLVQLATLPDEALLKQARSDLSVKLLRGMFGAGSLLEERAAPALPPDEVSAAIDALARVQQVQGWPLAAWLQVHYAACYAGKVDGIKLESALSTLIAAPEPKGSGGFDYRAWGQKWSQRKAMGQPLCYLSVSTPVRAAAATAAVAAAPAAAAPPPAPVPSPAPPPAPAPTAVTGLRDLTELTVPNCGAACPSFIVIPNPGKPVTLGSGGDARTVSFDHRFAMGKTEVTVGQWKAFVEATKHAQVKTDTNYCKWNDGDYAKNDQHPVRCVNVADAEAYAKWFFDKYAVALGASQGVRISAIDLPTDAQWEFSARGKRYTDKFLWADNASTEEKCRYAQYYECPGDVLPVGSRLKNDYLLHDMIGNVWEWTATPSGNETGASASRVVRGASFNDNYVDRLSLSNRGRVAPGLRNYNLGFRLVARIAP